MRSQLGGGQITEYLKESGQATVHQIAARIGTSDSRARALVRGMAADGLVEKRGDNRYSLRPRP